MARVGVYLRISEDRDGEQTATDRQRADCSRFAESRGWQAVDVFEDVDLSAFKRAVKRPEFERMLTAIREKRIDGVLAWKIDRLTRRQRDLVRLDEACEDAGGFIASVVENIDTRQPTGRFVAELLVAQARMESENSSIRLKRKAEEQAAEGRPQTGGWRMFGYSQDRSEIVPVEAELIREAAGRVLAGESVRGICWDFRRRGITTPTGGPWSQFPFKRMLRNAALSGQREHLGKPTQGTWPAILTPDETRRLRAVLDDPSRRKNYGARRYLLAGFLRCGLCGEPLISRPNLDGTRRYICARQPGNVSCGKLARLAEPVEEMVREAMLIVLDGVDLRDYLEQPSDHTAEVLDAIRADEEALEQLSRDCNVDKLITRAEWLASRGPITERLATNRQRLAQTSGRGVLGSIVGAGEMVREQWEGKGLDWQRAVIGAVIDHIVIEPAVKGSTKFRPHLVRIVWKF